MPVLSCFLIAERRGCSRRPRAPPARAGDDTRPDRPTSQTDPWRVTRGQGPVSLVTSTRPSPSDRGTLTTSQRGPNDRSLRANPYPEVTDPFCRLPLPTFVYRPEAVHLGDLMRCRVRTDAGIEHVPSLGVSRADHDARDGVKYTPLCGYPCASPERPSFLIANSFHGRNPQLE